MADSFYEYLAKMKMAAILNGSEISEKMYAMALEAIVEQTFFRSAVPNDDDILVAVRCVLSPSLLPDRMSSTWVARFLARRDAQVCVPLSPATGADIFRLVCAQH